MLSRIIGRRDLNNNLSWIKEGVKDLRGRPFDVRDELSQDSLLRIESKEQGVDDFCWVLGEDCWVCERWSYFMNVITKQEILDTHSGSTSTILTHLNE